MRQTGIEHIYQRLLVRRENGKAVIIADNIKVIE